MTAAHNLWEAVRLDRRGSQVRRSLDQPMRIDLADVGLTVLWQQSTEEGGRQLLWPLETAHVPLPTDVALSTAVFQDTHPYVSLPISFSLPTPGDRVLCMGCLDADAGDYTFSQGDFEAGRTLERYSPQIHVTEAQVSHVFTHHFAKGFVDGPCFVVDANLPHGMSGGPVLNEEGFVCGVVTAGAAEILGTSSSIVSLLYPLFTATVRLGVQLGPVRIDGIRVLYDLIGDGFVRTDGSETLVSLQPDDGDILVGIQGPPGSSAHVFDNFQSFQEGLPPSTAHGTHYRMKYSDPDA